MRITLDPKRLDQVMSWSLTPGIHDENADGNISLMEAVAYVAGEPWSDRPVCVCPVITSFVSSWHDVLPTDADRDRLLKPLIPRLIGTKSNSRVEECRAYMAFDWLIRVHAPKFLELLPSLAAHAQAMRDASEIADIGGATAVGALAHRVSDAAASAKDAAGPTVEGTSRAWFAAWEAAGDAVRTSAGDAAREAAADAVRASVGDAVRKAAGDTAGDAVDSAARAASLHAAFESAWDAAAVIAWFAAEAAALAAMKDATGNDDAAAYAAWDAAVKVLAPTVESLQPTALDLVGRMIDVR